MSPQERIVEAAANDERAAATAKAPPATNDDDSDAGFADFLKVFVCLDNEATDAADDADEADDGSNDGGLAELTQTMASMEGTAAAGDDDETSKDDEELAAFERAIGAVGASQSTPAKKEMEDTNNDKSSSTATTNNAASSIDDDEDFDTFLDLLESSAPLPPSTRTALQSARAANSSDEVHAIWSEVLDGMSTYRKIQLAHQLQVNEDVERMMADPPKWLLEEHPKPSWRGCVRYWLGGATEEQEEGKAGEQTMACAVAVEGERIERDGPETA